MNATPTLRSIALVLVWGFLPSPGARASETALLSFNPDAVRIDADATTATWRLETGGLVFPGAVKLGDTLGALIIPERRWPVSGATALKLYCSSAGSGNEEALFDVSFYLYEKGELSLVGAYEGIAQSLSAEPSAVPLKALDSLAGALPNGDFSRVNAIQITWNSAGRGDITLHRLASEGSAVVVDPPAPTPTPAPVKPQLTVSGNLSAFRAQIRRSSPPQSLSIRASGLKAPVRVQASKGFQVSLQKQTGYAGAVEISGSGGRINPARKLWVRLAATPTPATSVSGALTVASRDAKSTRRNLSGRVARR